MEYHQAICSGDCKMNYVADDLIYTLSVAAFSGP